MKIGGQDDDTGRPPIKTLWLIARIFVVLVVGFVVGPVILTIASVLLHKFGVDGISPELPVIGSLAAFLCMCLVMFFLGWLSGWILRMPVKDVATCTAVAILVVCVGTMIEHWHDGFVIVAMRAVSTSIGMSSLGLGFWLSARRR